MWIITFELNDFPVLNVFCDYRPDIQKDTKKIHSQKSHRFDKENVWLNSGKRLDEISLIFYGV